MVGDRGLEAHVERRSPSRPRSPASPTPSARWSAGPRPARAHAVEHRAPAEREREQHDRGAERVGDRDRDASSRRGADRDDGGEDRAGARRVDEAQRARRRSRPDQKPSPAGCGPKRASRDSGASIRSPSRGTSSADAEHGQHDHRRASRSGRVAEADAVDHRASPTIVTVNVDRQPEHDAQRPPPPAGGAADSSAGSTGSTHGEIGGAGAGDEREQRRAASRPDCTHGDGGPIKPVRRLSTPRGIPGERGGARRHRRLAQTGGVTVVLLQSTASASRSTWSGSVLQGKRISSSQPTAAKPSTYARTVSSSTAALEAMACAYSPRNA